MLQLFSPSRIPPPNLIPVEHFAQEALTTIQSFTDVILPQVGATVVEWIVPGFVRRILIGHVQLNIDGIYFYFIYYFI